MAHQAHHSPSVAQIQAAGEAGASTFFRILAAVDPEAVEVTKNLLARKVARATEPDDPDPAEIRHVVQRSGSFAGAAWDGSIAEALYRADAVNTRIIVRTFDEDVLLAALAADRGSIESAESWLNPYLDRYGWPDE